jgi:thymidylate synthase (FAD)
MDTVEIAGPPVPGRDPRITSAFEIFVSPILDHGFVGLVETWGSDERVVEAARMSSGKGFLGWDPGPCPTCEGCRLQATGAPCETCDGKGRLAGDAKLLRYLYEHKHATPFEMAGLVIEVQAPILVFRQWQRHRTQSYNEMSARYTPLPDVNYIPTVERLMMGAGGSNKQAGTIAGAGALTEEGAEMFRSGLAKIHANAEDLYQSALRVGVPKELARVHLPVGRYSRMRSSANLRNWLAFLTLRMDAHAEWEIREFANAVGVLIANRFPRTWGLFAEGRT